MTISTTVKKKTYTGDGVTTAFPTTFPFFDDDEIVVTELVIATGVETVKTLTTHYTVSGGGGSTGTVTAVSPPPSTVTWTLSRATARTQETDYTANDPFPAETHERALDRLTLVAQEVEEKTDRSLKFPISDSAALTTEMPASAARANKILSFDGSGNPTAVAAAAVDLATVTPIGAALLQADDAAEAQQAIGVEVGVDVQAFDSELAALAALTSAADKVPYFTDSETAGLLDFLDEDDMASDSATAVPSQQSVKAYVDTEIAAIPDTGITRAGPTNLASTTGAEFTGLPAGLNRIYVLLNGVSLDDTDKILIRIGDSGGLHTSGYFSTSRINAGAVATSTAGFIIQNDTASDAFTGFMVLARITGNVWANSHIIAEVASEAYGAGYVTLDTDLDRIAILDSGGDNFDAGSISIMYE